MFSKDYTIKGIHADYMRYLIGSSEGSTLGKSSKIFDYGYQVLFIAPLIGVSYNLKPEITKIENMNFTVPIQQIINNKSRLEKIYRMVLLSEKSLKLDTDERVDFVFKPNKLEKVRGNELFKSYVRGGIEWLYDEIAQKGSTVDEKLNNIMDSMNEYIIEFGVYKEEEREQKIKEYEEEYE